MLRKMRYPSNRGAVLAASLVACVHALDGILAPETVAANSDFQVTFQNGNADQYRVYLAAALAGVNGPTCTVGFCKVDGNIATDKQQATFRTPPACPPHSPSASQQP